MKLRNSLFITIVAMAVSVVASAAANADETRKMLLHNDATVAGAQLARGSYNVEWQTQSPMTKVSFLQGSKVVVTAEGKVVDRGKKYPSNQVLYNEAGNGRRVIRELRFKGSSEVIEFNE